MQPFNRFSMNMSLDRSQILNYTTDFHFVPVRGGRFVDMQHFKLAFLKSPSIYVFIYLRYIKGLSYKYQLRALIEFATFLQPR